MIGQEGTYRDFRIMVSIVLWVLVFVSTLFGIPYIMFVQLKALKLPEHSNRHQVWASCILLAILVPLITGYFIYVSQNRYYEASAAADFRNNYKLTVVFLVLSFFFNFAFAYFYDFIASCCNYQLELDICICKCETLKIARLLTCTIIGLVFNALHLLTLCGYAIILAIVASPFHAMPVLLLYLSCIYVFVITVSESMKKSCICLIIVLLMNIILSVLIILLYFIMVTLIGEYSKEEGLWSEVGGILPISLHILLGYFIREIINLLSLKVKTD